MSEINIDSILEMLNREFTQVMRNNPKLYQNTKVIISNEQQLLRKQDMKSGSIFLIVKLLPATINFGQTILPMTITAMSERNSVAICQQLLIDFAQTYNLATNNDETIRQYYTTPSVLNAFNEIGTGYRASMFLNGTLLISLNANSFDVFLDDETEKLPVITCSDSLDIQGDRQAFFTTNDFAKSKSTVASYQLNLVMYNTDSDFLNKVLNIKFGNLSIDTIFNFTIKYKNGITSGKMPMKLVNATINQNVGELPTINMSFTK